MGSSAKVFETVSNHFLQRRANDRQRKHEMEMLDKQLTNAQDVANIKAGFNNPKYGLSWASPNAAGGAKASSLHLKADPTDSSLFKDENDRVLEMRKAINVLATKEKSEIQALLAGRDPNHDNHAAYNQVKQIFDLYASTALKENRSQTTGELVSWQSLMDLDAFDNAALRAEFIDPIHLKKMNFTGQTRSAKEIVDATNIYNDEDANYSTGQQKVHLDFAQGLLNMGDAFIMNNATEEKIVSAMDGEGQHLLTDIGTYYHIMNSALNNANYKVTGNIVSYTNRTSTEKKLIPEMQQMKEALVNGTETSYEILKALFGYRDRYGNIIQGIGYDSVGAIHSLELAIEGLMDFKTDVGKRFGAQASKMRKYNSRLLNRAKGTFGKNDEGFWTGAKDVNDKTIRDKKFDGMTLEEAFSFDFSTQASSVKEKMARVKALQIHLAFQVAIAEQGFEGGKAVSDADFQRAWDEIGAGGSGIFGMQSIDELKGKMVAVIGRFGRGMAYTEAYLTLGDGKRQQGALLSEKVLRAFWENKVSNTLDETGHPNDFGWWASREVFYKKARPDLLWHENDLQAGATYRTYRRTKPNAFGLGGNKGANWNEDLEDLGVLG